MTRKYSTVLGCFYIVIGLLLNPWLVAATMSPDGKIESLSTIGVICLVEVFLVGLGLLTIRESRRSWIANLNLALWTIAITVPILGEIAFRTAIVLKIPAFRAPGLYANWYVDDDFWLLEQRWNHKFEYPSPQRVNQLLGWSQSDVTVANQLGLDSTALSRLASGAPKILFFGDSYVRGAASRAFQLPEYLNDHLSGVTVVDLSVGGYGLDQIYLMFKGSHENGATGLNLVGILVDDDLDRIALSVRTAQKPYFVFDEHGALSLRGIPIRRDQRTYLMESPLRLGSFFLAFLKERLIGSDQKVDLKQRISAALLNQFVADAGFEKSKLVFVLFYTEPGLRSTTWQESFLQTYLRRSGARVIDTKPLLLKYAADSGNPIASLYKPGNGHHNDAGNRILGEALLVFLKQQGYVVATGHPQE